jgi:hypothetical protein
MIVFPVITFRFLLYPAAGDHFHACRLPRERVVVLDLHRLAVLAVGAQEYLLHVLPVTLIDGRHRAQTLCPLVILQNNATIG